MRSRRVRICLLLGLVATTGMLFAGSTLACTSLAFDQAAQAVNFCFLFDCQNGALGGLIQFCDTTTTTDTTDPNHSLLADCDQIQTTTTP
jgi:hypothetical protein